MLKALPVKNVSILAYPASQIKKKCTVITHNGLREFDNFENSS